ncbi:MAG: ABC transporter ATP-binding protein/permease [Cytophagaceae bacterium]|jgi:ATP-binding cassette subfamily B protein|nr:ABC transporter ATP-binding protein/permease [Cytophagaceae bacterium]
MQKEVSGNVSGNVFDIRILRKLYQYVQPYKGLFYLQILLTITGAGLAAFKPYLIQQVLDVYIVEKNLSGLYLMVGILVAILVLHAILQYFDTYIAGVLGQNIIRDIRKKLFQHIIQFKLSFFDKTPIGRLVTRNISDIETLSSFASEGLAGIFGDFLQLLFILGFMFYMDWRLTLISLCPLPLLLVSTYVFKERIKESFNNVRVAVSNLNTFVQEHISGMTIVQLFTAEHREYTKFKEINAQHRDANLDSVKYYSIYFPVAEFIGSLGLILLMWWGAYLVLDHSASPGVLISFIMYLSMFFRPIRMIADRFNTLQMSVVSSDRIFTLLEDASAIQTDGQARQGIQEGKIEFQNVHFQYNDDKKVLENVSFTVEPGKTVAIVGATGAGKTSIINLLNRLYDIQSGDILIDGKNIQTYTLPTLRSSIGLVLQDVFLFSDTIRNNITLYDSSITDEQIKHAIHLVGAEKFIDRLPGGLDYKVMERGATLSAGQRQILSFIRVLVFNPKILVLDEATSSIDSETETLIQQAIHKMMEGRTCIVIAHRLSTIQHASRILVMDKGVIVESGTHDTLMQQDGLYQQLQQMQFAQAK